jgi:hypothetical protein
MGLSQKSLTQIEKFFLFRFPMNPYTDWKAKLERAHFFKVQSDRITVCGACGWSENLKMGQVKL